MKILNFFRLLCFFCFLLFSVSLSAQDYVDLVKLNYGKTFTNTFKGTNSEISIDFANAEVTIPVKLSETRALITGVNYSYSHIKIMPIPEVDPFGLHSTTLKLGLASQWNEKWSSSVILLPKIASTYQQLHKDDFLLGIFASFKHQKKENFAYRFGFYGSREAYGIFATPTLGLYYLSDNNKFEMNLNIPLTGDINYKLGAVSLGLDYVGISRSYFIYDEDLGDDQPLFYVDLDSIDFSGYLQANLLKNSVLLKAKLGYGTDNYRLFATDEKIDLKLSAFRFGDDRTQINPDMTGSFFVMLEMVYRLAI